MTSIIKFRRSLYQVWTTFFSLIFFVCILWLLDENREEILIVATLSLDVTADTFQIFAKILVKVFPRVLPLFCNKGFTFNLYMISIMKFRCSLYQVSTTFFFLIFFVCILWLLNENREEILIVATVSLEVTDDTFQIFAKILVKVFPKGFTFILYQEFYRQFVSLAQVIQEWKSSPVFPFKHSFLFVHQKFLDTFSTLKKNFWRNQNILKVHTF